MMTMTLATPTVAVAEQVDPFEAALCLVGHQLSTVTPEDLHAPVRDWLRQQTGADVEQMRWLPGDWWPLDSITGEVTRLIRLMSLEVRFCGCSGCGVDVELSQLGSSMAGYAFARWVDLDGLVRQFLAAIDYPQTCRWVASRIDEQTDGGQWAPRDTAALEQFEALASQVYELVHHCRIDVYCHLPLQAFADRWDGAVAVEFADPE